MTLTVNIRHRLGAFALDAAFTAEGGVTALFGRSGSGKTSLIRSIAGLIHPDHGHVALDGRVLTDTDQNIFVPRHRRRFGYVFQEARLFPHLSVRHNLGYGRWFAPKTTDRDDFDSVVDLLGLGPLLERRPGKLSGGEKQRVAIGRALLSNPRLLLMDEPLAALDEERKAEILPYLERLRDETKIPIVYVSHAIAEVARLASRVVLLRDGHVEAVGSAVEVLSLPSTAEGAERREAGVLLEGRIDSISQTHLLSTVALKTAKLQVPGTGFPVGRMVRIHVPARDVMLATVRPEGLSALNILEGTITWIGVVANGALEVRLNCGGDPILSRITQLSGERLRLAVGMTVFAVIKTVALQNG
ncbi:MULTISPECIES: molybdenum ABC transporter ATP-binding protein [Rhizobium]|uniref:Molybdenum ABC transporter ATP-binding protein n=1 Tax=Rhizobium rhododendri TaxID=2506430 RepID=A0ABY8IFX4_9HYPH|nr:MULTISPECIES: molybdenum ABC transporter ATP-binding protein [Rhizobium]MBO9100360.1 molybdenum ABC transporter ATP-binding protein [Rhizobium sp. L58/93]MBO9135500.1 molybdenum ABC transporter ATP-binding protein [Rhizobium sp. B209b/85]MBO9170296.1 molybdenum ABC transporter ATP-binding protein [Rhizobium sp. L245/93]MBO9186253.1 molybdenum ABC transporter ATP-binding protein [Rhizobium sp. E27B/91]MBZ5760641.1 molybdenum ABC transporter ATP-binding protein [Rhizobium sp. VS19-DR96]